MNENAKRVVNLRELGYTYSQISKELGIQKSTISYICNKFFPNNKVLALKNASYARLEQSLQLKKKDSKARVAADKYYKKRKKEAMSLWTKRIKLVPIGHRYYMAGFYDGDGNHSRTDFTLVNSNKKIISFCLDFLKKIKAEVIITLVIHKTQDKDLCLDHWKLGFKYVRQNDTRKQSRDYSKKRSARQSFGTVTISVVKPLGLRDVVMRYSPSQMLYH